MYYFLDFIPVNKLKRYLSKDYYQFLSDLPSGLNRNQTYSALFAIHGYSLLDDVNIRRLIVENFSEDILIDIRKALRIKIEIKPYDLALKFANTKWSPNSEQSLFFKRALSLDAKFLPHYSPIGPSHEELTPPAKYLEPFPYQREVIEKILTFLSSNNQGSCIIQMPTGSGKTKTILDAIAIHIRESTSEEQSINILWLGHTEELCNQSVDAFKSTWSHLGDRKFNIQRFWGRHKLITSEIYNTLLVTTYQKLSTLRNNDPESFSKIKSAVKIIIADEAHKATARTYKRFLLSIIEDRNIFLIGLTATPGRAHFDQSENLELAKLFGQKLIRPEQLGDNPILELQKHGILSNIVRESIASNIDLDLKQEEMIADDIPDRILKKLENSNDRNNLITNKINELSKASIKSIVFSCSIQHSKILALNQAICGNASAFITADMPQEIRRSTIKLFRSGQIMSIFNFGVLSTGFDVPDLGAVIIARPTNSIILYSQMIGRGLRGPKMGGSNECLLIDIKDNFRNFGGVDEVYNYFSDYWSNYS